MITIFTHTKPFIEHFDIIQYNAIKSWRAISDDVEMIIYGDAEGSDNMAEEVNAKRVKSVPKSENGMPLLTYLFDQQVSQQILAYNIHLNIIELFDYLINSQLYSQLLIVYILSPSNKN